MTELCSSMEITICRNFELPENINFCEIKMFFAISQFQITQIYIYVKKKNSLLFFKDCHYIF